MIKVTIEVELDGMTLQYEKETYGVISGGNSVVQAEKAESLLLEGYHKIKAGIESQK
jgi:hypothetical protein